MKKTICLMLCLAWAWTLSAQKPLKNADTRCLQFMGIPMEGPADSLVSEMKRQGFTEWGTSDDGDEQDFRGNFYGMRSKVLVSRDALSGYVSTISVTIGPYRTAELFDRNYRYFLYKMKEDYGDFSARGDAYYHVSDYGVVKLSDEQNDNGTRNIKVFFLTTAPFFKDALNMGLRGNVMEVITTNPIMENPVEHFARDGKTEEADLTERRYDRYGYLLGAEMKEENGETSLITYDYDRQHRLTRRTLVNKAAGIRQVNDYSYNDDDEITKLSQKVFDVVGTCLYSLTLNNEYIAHDDAGNWTTNNLKVVYWEKETGSQETEVQQTRQITYWED